MLADQRSKALPNVPTISEAGYPGAEMVLWNAVFAPKGTPPEIVKQLNAAIAKGIEAPAVTSGSRIWARNPRAPRSGRLRRSEKSRQRHREVGQGDPRRRHQAN